MAVAKSWNRWYNSKNKLMFGSISHSRTYIVV
nr:MAG TPA: 4'-phosphopantetheinyl transferase [Caudoviricetes sp.]